MAGQCYCYNPIDGCCDIDGGPCNGNIFNCLLDDEEDYYGDDGYYDDY